jgi:site-specific DNA recombinase
MNIVIYTRVSTSRQAEEGVSMSDQIRQIKAWSKDNKHHILRTFEEPGSSAFYDTRPVFLEMKSWIKDTYHNVDAIVVHSMSRFFRFHADSVLLERELEKDGIKIISITQPLPEDENSAILMRNMVGVFDEHQSRETGKHVIRCMRANAKAGYFNGSKPPYGYTAIQTDKPARSGWKRKLSINPTEAQVVKEIFSLALHGTDGVPYGLKKITTHLDHKGQLKRNRKWTMEMVNKLLRDTIYIGKHTTFKKCSATGKIRKESEWITTKVSRIIDDLSFELVGKGLSERSPSKGKNRVTNSGSILTGLLICKRCSSPMVIYTGKSGKYKYYGCSRRKKINNSLCDCPNIRKEKIEDQIINILIEILNFERISQLISTLIKKVKSDYKSELPRIRSFKRELVSTEEKLRLLYDQIGLGELTLDLTLKDYLARLQHRASVLNDDISELERKHNLPIKKFGEKQIQLFCDDVHEVFINKENREKLRPYICSLIDKILIGKNEITVHGSNFELAKSISNYKSGQPLKMVPSNTSDWRRWADSNRHGITPTTPSI